VADPASADRVVRLEMPWLEPFSHWAKSLDWPAAQSIDLGHASELAASRDCRSGSGQRLRFVDARALDGRGSGYERMIFDAGQVATRTEGPGTLHDFANALVWLAFPRLKARLNALHVDAQTGPNGSGRRGGVRDRATLFDESGAFVLTQNPELANLMRGFAWRELFVKRRAAWPDQIRVLIVGHALLEKLRAPYKSICAQAWVLDCPTSIADNELDRHAARMLNPESLAALTPVPLMGIPGWSSANHDPAFYNDSKVFRSGRRQ
jgi:hypothetical protein